MCMKRLFSLLVFTSLIGTASLANNDVEPTGDPEPEQQEGQYTFSLSKAYFAFFNLFTVETIETDTTKTNQALIPREEEIEQKFLPL